MKIYDAKILKFEDVDEIVRNIVWKFLQECFGVANGSYTEITFYDEGDGDDWSLGWITTENKKLVEKWLDENEIDRSQEYLIDHSW